MKKKFDSLNALKALACLMVFANHSGIKLIGTGAISVFYITSGFTLVYSYHDRVDALPHGFAGSLRFAVKRVAKLYPLYIICMLPVLALDLFDLRNAFSVEALAFIFKKLLASLLLIQSWFPNTDIALAFNGVAWYLSTAMFLYFCAPFLIRLVNREAVRKWAVPVILLLAAIQFALGFAMAPVESFIAGRSLGFAPGRFSYWFTYIFPPFRVPDFAMGCLLGVFYLDHKDSLPGSKKPFMTNLVLCALWISAALIYWHTDSFLTGEAFKYTQLFIFPALAAVYVFVVDNSPLVRLLTNRFTLFISRISSDFFLLHQNIIRFSILFLSMLTIPFDSLKLIIPILCFALTIAACLIWSRLEAGVRRIIKGK